MLHRLPRLEGLQDQIYIVRELFITSGTCSATHGPSIARRIRPLAAAFSAQSTMSDDHVTSADSAAASASYAGVRAPGWRPAAAEYDADDVPNARPPLAPHVAAQNCADSAKAAWLAKKTPLTPHKVVEEEEDFEELLPRSADTTAFGHDGRDALGHHWHAVHQNAADAALAAADSARKIELITQQGLTLSEVQGLTLGEEQVALEQRKADGSLLAHRAILRGDHFSSVQPLLPAARCAAGGGGGAAAGAAAGAGGAADADEQLICRLTCALGGGREDGTDAMQSLPFALRWAAVEAVEEDGTISPLLRREALLLAMIAQAPHAAAAADANGWLPLHVALRFGAPLVAVQALLKAYPSALLVATVEGGCLPWHYAAGFADAAAVAYLRAAMSSGSGASLQRALNTLDARGVTPRERLRYIRIPPPAVEQSLLLILQYMYTIGCASPAWPRPSARLSFRWIRCSW